MFGVLVLLLYHLLNIEFRLTKSAKPADVPTGKRVHEKTDKHKKNFEAYEKRLQESVEESDTETNDKEQLADDRPITHRTDKVLNKTRVAEKRDTHYGQDKRRG